ncbi:MAG: mobile mystery protein A [Pedobacter sp.]|nr:MAG: mobile mystery protein A [Pedobacter sp.]
MNEKKLQIAQLESKLKGFEAVSRIPRPDIGWLKMIRSSLGMSLQQVANKLAITKQSVQEIENREKEGTITLNNLKETANALDMQLVYGFVPNDGTLEDLIERKAKELALRIVSRTSNTMKLEDQENSTQRLKTAIEERSAILKNELPKSLWD